MAISLIATDKNPNLLENKVIVFDEFYRNIDEVYKFSKVCPKRAFSLLYIKGMESVFPYVSESAIDRIKDALGAREVIDKSDEQCLFGLFRYMLEGKNPDQVGVHVDTQPWTLIVYISQTVDVPATAIYRHKRTGVYDLGLLDVEERERFMCGPLKEDQYDSSAWEVLFSTPFKQNSALLFKAQDLLHSNVSTWGADINSARITQNFNFQVRY
jgi:hypothetical protein